MKYFRRYHVLTVNPKDQNGGLIYKGDEKTGEAWMYDRQQCKWQLCYTFDGMQTKSYFDYILSNIIDYREITETEAFLELL